MSGVHGLGSIGDDDVSEYMDSSAVSLDLGCHQLFFWGLGKGQQVHQLRL